VDFYLQNGGDPVSPFAELSDKIMKAVERRRVIHELKEKSDYLNKIFLSVKEGIAIIDADTHEILDVNPAVEALIGADKRKYYQSSLPYVSLPCRGREMPGKQPASDSGSLKTNTHHR